MDHVVAASIDFVAIGIPLASLIIGLATIISTAILNRAKAMRDDADSAEKKLERSKSEVENLDKRLQRMESALADCERQRIALLERLSQMDRHDR